MCFNLTRDTCPTRDIVLCIWIDLNMVKLCQDKGFFLLIFVFEQQL